MDFLPKHHALLFSTIARVCITRLSKTCIPFLKETATEYGKHRASRMAKRALADGCIPNALSFLNYGELNVSPELITRTSSIIDGRATITTSKCPCMTHGKKKVISPTARFSVTSSIRRWFAASMKPLKYRSP